MAGTVEKAPFQLLTNLRVDGPVQPNSSSLYLTWALPGGHGDQIEAAIEFVDAISGEVMLHLVESSREPATNLSLNGTTLLELHAYKWRISANMSDGVSLPWSDWASVTTGWIGGPRDEVAVPMWQDRGDGFVLFRREIDAPYRDDVVLALAAITANPQTTNKGEQNAKLLASYKLFLDGSLVGMGPGRVSTCGPVCPI